MSEPADEWLTIAEAARRMGMAERQARRWADKLADSDRTLDRTMTGRPRALVRFAALVEMEKQRTAAADTDRTAGKTDRTSDRTATGQGEAQATLPAVAYQRVMSEQAARIGELTTALEHERGQSRRLTDALQLAQENLQREQSLRLLTGAEAREMTGPPSEAGEKPEFSEPVTRARVSESDKSGNTGTAARRGWWGRLWGRG